MLFNFIFFIYCLVYFPYLILSGRWYPGYACRLGIIPSDIKDKLGSNQNIWIHAVSVGEIMAILPLVDQIKSHWPAYNLVVTATTKTGYELAQKELGSKAIVISSPLDFSWVAASFVKLIKPRIYIVAETEIWPNLFNYLSKHHIPILTINGRISDVSFGRYKAIKFLLKGVLNKVSLFCMQSDLDAKRIIELGAPADKVVSLGNVKFDDSSVAKEHDFPSLSYKDLPLWIAGSTHPGEEELVLEAYAKHKDSWGLLIAPRHIERSQAIADLVRNQGFKPVFFSQLSSASLEANSVIIVDAIGRLKSLYAKASLVFVGKSLCVGGGHNIIEPALYAKAIIIGPYMSNFRDITSLFKNQSAVIQVKGPEEFKMKVDALMTNAPLRSELGQKALEVVKANQGAVDRTIQILKKWL